MAAPKLALCNFIPDVEALRRMALSLGFDGVDWTFMVEGLPSNEAEERELRRTIQALSPLEVRYHCAFNGVDLGDVSQDRAESAVALFRRACETVAGLGGRYMTIHLGLGRVDYEDLSWDRSVKRLERLVAHGRALGVRVCLENLASGWSSRPELFEKLVRKSNASVTLDIGHARMSPSVQSQRFDLEDLVTPHHRKICNAHIYHEERAGGHTAPDSLADLEDRLHLLTCLPCDWWVLELREESALLKTLQVVREFLGYGPDDSPPAGTPIPSPCSNQLTGSLNR
ncbi:MAG: sugar phosphate isomerase/epimerase [Syntrophobacteraceae bacterium]|nr:sugar phosphate isomerase/epimerase [Syntrophobacteraceae bacterium]